MPKESLRNLRNGQHVTIVLQAEVLGEPTKQGKFIDVTLLASHGVVRDRDPDAFRDGVVEFPVTATYWHAGTIEFHAKERR